MDSGFEVLFRHGEVQAARMVLDPGSHTGGPGNRHAGADQWLWVVSGKGTAVVNGREQALGPASLLLIERGEAHEIRCLGTDPLCTLNFYSPPAYDADGEPLPAGED